MATTKRKVTFYVEGEVIDKFKENADKKALNQSKWIENKLIEFNNQCKENK